jgi:hypothetical protein
LIGEWTIDIERVGIHLILQEGAARSAYRLCRLLCRRYAPRLKGQSFIIGGVNQPRQLSPKCSENCVIEIWAIVAIQCVISASRGNYDTAFWRYRLVWKQKIVVGGTGIEPVTPTMST